MTGLEEALIIGAIVGAATAATGTIAWVGQRLHTKLDSICLTLNGEGGHTSRLAVIESKLPNGEWREVGAAIKRVETKVEAVQKEQVAVRKELADHAESEESRLVEAILKFGDHPAEAG